MKCLFDFDPEVAVNSPYMSLPPYCWYPIAVREQRRDQQSDSFDHLSNPFSPSASVKVLSITPTARATHLPPDGPCVTYPCQRAPVSLVAACSTQISMTRSQALANL